MVEQDDVIVADKLCIDFPIYGSSGQSLRHKLLLNPFRKLPKPWTGSESVGGTVSTDSGGTIVVSALKDINIRIKKGDRVGLIGHNGCGKTTLLQTFAGVYEPTGGTLRSEGVVMPLFNLTEGMAPEATGREFIYTRCTVLGFHRGQIEEILPDVVEFCQLGDYLDMPVRMYSTGMLVRLAFAITTSLSADILLFDELIGAGDANFVDKAQVRLAKFVERSNVLVVASHSTSIIEKWCNRAILLDHGNLIFDGEVNEALEVYKQRIAKSKAS